MMLWGYLTLVILLLLLLFWAYIRQKKKVLAMVETHLELEQKVVHLEQHLTQTLDLVQDMAKNMQAQQHKVNVVEKQNAELVILMTKIVQLPK